MLEQGINVKKRVVLTRPEYVGVAAARTTSTLIPSTSKQARLHKHHTPPPHSPLYGGGEVGGGVIANRTPEQQQKNEVEQALDVIRQFSPEQQQALLDQLALQTQLQRSTAEIRDVEMWSVAVYESLQKALGGGGAGSAGPMLVKRVVASPSAWRPIAQFMRAGRLTGLKATERNSIYCMLADLLVGHARRVARRSGAPLSVKLVGNCAGSISGVFEAAFPGYLQAGLVPIVARQLLAGAAA